MLDAMYKMGDTVGLLKHLRLKNLLFQGFEKCDLFGKGFGAVPMAEIGRLGARWKALGKLLLAMHSTFTLHACALSRTKNTTRKTWPTHCLRSPTVYEPSPPPLPPRLPY